MSKRALEVEGKIRERIVDDDDSDADSDVSDTENRAGRAGRVAEDMARHFVAPLAFHKADDLCDLTDVKRRKVS
eukprot:ANDGO_08078.mRNA.1 hypothetical protein